MLRVADKTVRQYGSDGAQITVVGEGHRPQPRDPRALPNPKDILETQYCAECDP